MQNPNLYKQQIESVLQLAGHQVGNFTNRPLGHKEVSLELQRKLWTLFNNIKENILSEVSKSLETSFSRVKFLVALYSPYDLREASHHQRSKSKDVEESKSNPAKKTEPCLMEIMKKKIELLQKNPQDFDVQLSLLIDKATDVADLYIKHHTEEKIDSTILGDRGKNLGATFERIYNDKNYVAKPAVEDSGVKYTELGFPIEEENKKIKVNKPVKSTANENKESEPDWSYLGALVGMPINQPAKPRSKMVIKNKTLCAVPEDRTVKAATGSSKLEKNKLGHFQWLTSFWSNRSLLEPQSKNLHVRSKSTEQAAPSNGGNRSATGTLSTTDGKRSAPSERRGVALLKRGSTESLIEIDVLPVPPTIKK